MCDAIVLSRMAVLRLVLWQGYYRKGMALIGLGKFNAAKLALEKVCHCMI